MISINRATWCLGVVLAAMITGIAAANWGWRVAVMVPAAIALLAIYVGATCPESPYWVRAQDRKRRIAETLTAGGVVLTITSWSRRLADRLKVPRTRHSLGAGGDAPCATPFQASCSSPSCSRSTI